MTVLRQAVIEEGGKRIFECEIDNHDAWTTLPKDVPHLKIQIRAEHTPDGFPLLIEVAVASLQHARDAIVHEMQMIRGQRALEP